MARRSLAAEASMAGLHTRIESLPVLAPWAAAWETPAAAFMPRCQAAISTPLRETTALPPETEPMQITRGVSSGRTPKAPISVPQPTISLLFARVAGGNYRTKTTPFSGRKTRQSHTLSGTQSAFGIGADDKHIATVDESGLALAAIQGLNQKLEDRLQQKETEITELKQRLEKMEQMMNQKNGGAK